MSTFELEWDEGRHLPVNVVASGDPVVVLAHGAGTFRSHPSIVGLAEALASTGLGVVTFDYPYRAEGRKPPDRLPILLAAHRGVARWVRDELDGDIVLAGRSMGGRVGTHLAAEGEPCLGVVLFAYPLHPAGKPDRLRVEHLTQVPVPMLFFQGTRDPLSRGDLFDRHVRPLPAASVVDLEGADHSHRIRGVPIEEVWRRMAVQTRRWVDGL